MVDTDIWTQIHPLKFQSSFALLWREDIWKVKLTDYDDTIDLKAETLKVAFEEVRTIFLEKKYLQPKKRKIAREGKKATKKKNVVKRKTSK